MATLSLALDLYDPTIATTFVGGVPAVTEDTTPTLTGIVKITDPSAVLTGLGSTGIASYSFAYANGASGKYGTFSWVGGDVDPSRDVVERGFSFTLGNAAQALRQGQTAQETIILTATDGAGKTVTSSIVITITGTNDAPVLTAATGSTLTPDAVAEIAGNSSAQNLAAITGTLTVNDKDVGDTLTATAQLASVQLNGNNFILPSDAAPLIASGAFVLTSQPAASNGGNRNFNWKYDPAAANLDFLAQGQTLTITYAVTVSDSFASDTKNVTITIKGTNDAPVINSTSPAFDVSETLSETNATLSTTGRVVFSDVDSGDTPEASVFARAVSATGITLSPAQQDAIKNAFSITDAATGAWSFNLASPDYLPFGATVTATFTVRVTDDAGAFVDQPVTITINGTNDSPVITGTTSGTVVEAGNLDNGTVVAGTPSVSGTVSVTDPDAGATQAYSGNATSTYGAFTVDATTGTWTYTLNNGAANVLAEGQSVTETFTVTVTDDKGATADLPVTITINGTNDSPTLVATVTNIAYTDTANDDTFTNMSGQLTSTDPDAGSMATYGVSGGTASTALSGYDTAKTGAYGVLYVNSSSGAYVFVPNDTAIEGLRTNAQETYTLTVTDNFGATGTQTLTVNLTGANDTPQVVAMPTYTETQVTLTVSDRDIGDVLTVKDPASGFVSTTLNNGSPTSLTVQAVLVRPSGSALTIQDQAGVTVIAGSIDIGTDGDDLVLGINTSGAVYGLKGNDTLVGSTQADYLFGGDGNDVLRGSGGADYLYGGNGDDTLAVLDTAAVLYSGGANTDTLSVELNSFTPTSDAQIVDIERVRLAQGGSTTNNSLDLSNQSEGFTILGNSSNDTIVATNAADTIDGGATLGVNGGTDNIDARGGDDTIRNVTVASTVNGGDGTDVLEIAAASYVQANSAAGDARLVNVETIRLTSTGGTTLTLTGQTEGFTIVGGAGADAITGGNGFDRIFAAQNDTTINGGNGTDTLVVEANFDDMSDGQITSIERVEIGVNTGVVLSLEQQAGEAFTIVGGAGNDTITSADGADTIDGGDGDDVINAGSGNDTVVGGNGNDTILGGLGNDTLTGGSGADTIDAGDGNDTIIVTDSLDTIDGGAGTDVLRVDSASYTAATDGALKNVETVTLNNAAGVTVDLSTQTEGFTVNGSTGDDTITGGSGVDVLNGNNGNDTFISDSSSAGDTLSGGNGNDTLRLTANYISLADNRLGTIENVVLTVAGLTLDLTGADATTDQSEGFTITGSSGVDSIKGGAGADTIDGGAGADTINGGAGNDIIIADSADTIDGGTGADVLRVATASYMANGDAALAGVETVTVTFAAGATVNLGNQTEGFTINGGDGNDTLTGGSAADVINGGLGADTINAGDGNDTIVADALDTVDGGGGTADVLRVDATSFTAASDNALQNVERVTLNNAAGVTLDLSNQTEGFALITGSGGADTIRGGNGNDTINGGNGNDVLRGGRGDDTLQGQGGDDTFVFEASLLENGKDSVSNFAISNTGGNGVDVLDFTAYLSDAGSTFKDGAAGGTAFDAFTANVASGTFIDNSAVKLVGNYGTAAALQTALNTGAYSGFDLTNGAKALVFTSSTATGTSVNAFYVTGGAGNLVTADLVGTFTLNGGNFSQLADTHVLI